MTFIKITTTGPIAKYIATTIQKNLSAGKKVLWLVPGGSSIAIATEVSKLLADTDLTNLSMTLTDERYGEIGHPNSNWQQLADAGFGLPGALTVPVLTGEDRKITTVEYTHNLQELLNNADFSLGFFGIGDDGHTAGILPHSPAVSSVDLSASYDAGNFERVTITFKTICLLNEAVVYAAGQAKWPILDQLGTDIDLDNQPAQILKKVPKLTIFNDHKGDDV